MVSRNNASRAAQIPLAAMSPPGVYEDDDDSGAAPVAAAAPKSAHALAIENAQLKAELLQSNRNRSDAEVQEQHDGAVKKFLDWKASHSKEQGKLLKIFAFFAVLLIMTAVILSIPAPACKRVSKLPVYLKKSVTFDKVGFEIRFVLNRKSHTNGNVITLSKETGIDYNFQDLENAFQIYLSSSSLEILSKVNGRETNVKAMKNKLSANKNANVGVVFMDDILTVTVFQDGDGDDKAVFSEAFRWKSDTYDFKNIILLDGGGMSGAELTDLRIGKIPAVAHTVKACFDY
tara:strand:+ start:2988 stop:3854 length:867 start_codon:yes stop_codon:yes gene_type:complete